MGGSDYRAMVGLRVWGLAARVTEFFTIPPDLEINLKRKFSSELTTLIAAAFLAISCNLPGLALFDPAWGTESPA